MQVKVFSVFQRLICLRDSWNLFLCAAVMTCLSSCAWQTERMRAIMAEVQQRNQNFESLAGDTLMPDVVDYLDAHGTLDDRLMAHYLMGCVYRDRGQSLEALEEFQAGAQLADTTSNDCNYCVLGKIHAQSAAVLYDQLLPEEMLQELMAYEWCALRDGDTLSAVNAYENRAAAYELLGQDDSVIAIRQRVFNFYHDRGLHEDAVIAVCPIIPMLVERGEAEKARTYLSEYEAISSLWDEDGTIKENYRIYYFLKGLLLLESNRLDSAESMFRKTLGYSSDANMREAGYNGLMQLYKKKHQSDSVARYAELAYLVSDSVYLDDNKNRVQTLHTLYNYEAIRRVALQKSAESRETRLWLYVLLSLFAAVTLIVYILWRRKEERQKAMEQAFHSHVSELRQAQNDLIALHEQNVEKLVKEKNEKIEFLEDKITQYASLSKHFEPDTLEERLHSSSIYALFHSKLSNPTLPPSEQHWQELYDMINRELPRFFSILNSGKKPLSQDEYRLCILIRLGFRSKDCFVLMNIKPNRIANLRKSLLGKVFNQEGSSDDFDKKIMRIT